MCRGMRMIRSLAQKLACVGFRKELRPADDMRSCEGDDRGSVFGAAFANGVREFGRVRLRVESATSEPVVFRAFEVPIAAMASDAASVEKRDHGVGVVRGDEADCGVHAKAGGAPT